MPITKKPKPSSWGHVAPKPPSHGWTPPPPKHDDCDPHRHHRPLKKHHHTHHESHC